MSFHAARDNLAGLTVAMGGITFPYWNELLYITAGIPTFLTQLGGFIVLGLTIAKLSTDLRISRKKLKDGE